MGTSSELAAKDYFCLVPGIAFFYVMPRQNVNKLFASNKPFCLHKEKGLG